MENYQNKNKIEEKIILEGLSTEKRNPETMNLDEMNSLEIVQIMNKEDSKVPLAIKQILPNIAKVVDIAADTLKRKGRVLLKKVDPNKPNKVVKKL